MAAGAWRPYGELMLWISCSLGAKAQQLPDLEKLNPFTSRKDEKPEFREKLRSFKSFAHSLPRAKIQKSGVRSQKSE